MPEAEIGATCLAQEAAHGRDGCRRCACTASGEWILEELDAAAASWEAQDPATKPVWGDSRG